MTKYELGQELNDLSNQKIDLEFELEFTQDEATKMDLQSKIYEVENKMIRIDKRLQEMDYWGY